MTWRRYPLMILINQSRNHRYPLINRLSTRRPWQSRRVTLVRGSIGRYYNNNTHSPDFERFVWNPCKIGLVHNCLEPGQFTLISMGLIRYSCGHISGHHEPIYVKFGVWLSVRVFHHVLLKYGHENDEMQKRKFDDVTLRYSIVRMENLSSMCN